VLLLGQVPASTSVGETLRLQLRAQAETAEVD